MTAERETGQFPPHNDTQSDLEIYKWLRDGISSALKPGVCMANIETASTPTRGVQKVICQTMKEQEFRDATPCEQCWVP